MRQAHEGFEALLDVRHDHQLVHDGVRRLGGDDAGLGEADVTPADDALLGMADGGALHRALHRARTAARAHVQAAQAQLVAHLLGVLVFLGIDRVSAPAHHQVGLGLEIEHPRIAQDVEHRVGDGRRVVEVEPAAFDDLVGDEDHVAQHREHVFLDAADHLAVDEGLAGRVLHLELDAPGLAHQLHFEILVAVEDFLGVVALAAGIHHRQRALAEQLVEAAGARIEQFFDLGLGKVFEAAARSDARIHEIGNDDAGFQRIPSIRLTLCW